MKSHVRSLTVVCECVISDAYAKCPTDTINLVRDIKTMIKRTEDEGLSFLTITLPCFGKDFEKSLSKALVSPDLFLGFKKRLALPAFLQGLLGLVFDVDTGGLLHDPSIAAIEGIRQVAYTFKKLSLPCTPARERMALHGYEEVERVLSEQTMLPRDRHLFHKVSRLLWNSVFDEDYDSLRYIPKHGPGQTAERISGNRKYAQRRWYGRLEPFFPADSYIMSSFSQCMDKLDGINDVHFVPEECEDPVRICCVPKTLKGPRIIAIEPVCMQYAQQALSRWITSKIASSKLTSGHINFVDQSVNQRLALSASSDLTSATLDMSEASDRVPLSMVSVMLSGKTDLRDAVFACRSKAALMPSGRILRLKKLASMGSALCFPLESMYFFTVILTALFRKHKLPVTLRNLLKLRSGVYVYGDDIIVPVDEVDVVSETLTGFYCKVNYDKSFWNGKFRESCGMDAYDGECVTPTYLRTLQPTDKGSASEVVSWVATSNLFYLRGYWKTAAMLKVAVERLTGELPVVLKNSPGLGWTSFQGGVTVHRWNRKLHRPEVSTYVVSPVYKRDPLSGWSALLKYFLNSAYRNSDSLCAVDKKHLERSSRSGTSSIKRRWTTPY